MKTFVIASQVAERLKTQDVSKQVNIRKISNLDRGATQWPVSLPQACLHNKLFKNRCKSFLTLSNFSYFLIFFEIYFAEDCSYYLDILDKLNTPVCTTVGSSLVAYYERLTRKCTQLKSCLQLLFWQIFSGTAELVPLSCSRGRSTRYSNRLHNFSGTITKCCKDLSSHSQTL